MYRLRHRQPVTALAVVVALHQHPSILRTVHARTRAAHCQPPGRHRQPVTALAVVVAPHQHPSIPYRYILPRRWQPVKLLGRHRHRLGACRSCQRPARRRRRTTAGSVGSRVTSSQRTTAPAATARRSGTPCASPSPIRPTRTGRPSAARRSSPRARFTAAPLRSSVVVGMVLRMRRERPRGSPCDNMCYGGSLRAC